MSFLKTLGATAYTRTDFIQASDAPEMEGQFTNKLAQILGENLARTKDQKKPLNVIGLNIAGAADYFIVQFVLSDDDNLDGWKAADLPNAVARFWMGADVDALEDYQEAAIASLRNGAKSIEMVGMGIAGAGRTTRVMAFAAGIRKS